MNVHSISCREKIIHPFRILKRNNIVVSCKIYYNDHRTLAWKRCDLLGSPSTLLTSLKAVHDWLKELKKCVVTITSYLLVSELQSKHLRKLTYCEIWLTYTYTTISACRWQCHIMSSPECCRVAQYISWPHDQRGHLWYIQWCSMPVQWPLVEVV